MAAKKTSENKLNIEATKHNIITAELIGTSSLILSKKTRSYERYEIFRQTHSKGTAIPKNLDQGYHMWEKLITSIHWRDPIVYHDDDYSLYTEDEWNEYMTNNAPCVPQQMISGAMKEAFISFGYKDSTGKNGTDLTRGVQFSRPLYPLEIGPNDYDYEQKLVPNNGKDRVNVVCEHNIFYNWKVVVEFSCPEVTFPYDTIVKILNSAGKFVGLGTQHKNGYGRFNLGNVEVHSVEK